MADRYIRAGWAGNRTFTLVEDENTGVASNLTTLGVATVKAIVRKDGDTSETTYAITITTAASGIVTWTLAASDFDTTSGGYLSEDQDYTIFFEGYDSQGNAIAQWPDGRNDVLHVTPR